MSKYLALPELRQLWGMVIAGEDNVQSVRGHCAVWHPIRATPESGAPKHFPLCPLAEDSDIWSHVDSKEFHSKEFR